MGSPSVFAAAAQVPTADVGPVPAPAPLLVRRTWPQAIIALGLGLTAAWAGFLAYGFLKLVALAI